MPEIFCAKCGVVPAPFDPDDPILVHIEDFATVGPIWYARHEIQAHIEEAGTDA